ncbi:MAG: sialidase family protein [Armatimonadota bacterium]
MTSRYQPGTLSNVTVYAPEDGYAAFPCLRRTAHELILEFMHQPLAPLRASGVHPHYAPVMTRKAAVSRDGGLTWEVTDHLYPLREPLVATTRGDYYAATVLPDGSLYTISHLHVPGQMGQYQYSHRLRRTPSGEIAWEQPMVERGPLEEFNPFSLTRAPDGALLAGGYWYEAERAQMSVILLRSDDGATWHYLSKIASPGMFGLGEPGLLTLADGRIIAMLRAEWGFVKSDPAGWPDDVNGHGRARDGYGYYLYQSESDDNGRTWSTPRQLPLWGHPGFLLQLSSGNVLLVYGHRRTPYGIRAVLSRDGCRTWDLSTLRTLYTFDPGSYDIGYPVALQRDDGAICCAYYGYSTPDLGQYSPHGVFVSLFNEAWLTG